MPCQVQYIPLEQIRPIFNANIAEAYNKRMKKTSVKLLDYDLLLVVERDQSDNSYLLVGGYDKYHYLMNYTDLKDAPCIVEASTTPDETLLKILRRLFQHGDTHKMNKDRVLGILGDIGVSKRRIVDETPFTMSELNKKYYYNPSIPTEYINDNTKPLTLNEIEQLDVSPETKVFLFVRAGLPIGDPDRLTGQVLSTIKSYTKKDSRVKHLTPDQQIETFIQAFNPKKTIFEKLRETVNKFIFFRRAS